MVVFRMRRRMIAIILTELFLILSSNFVFANNIAPIREEKWPISEKTFKSKYLSASQPVLFRGAASSWPSSSWNFDFFISHFPETDVTVQLKENLTNDQYGAVESLKQNMKLESYIKNIQNYGIKAGYLSQFDILNIHPKLKDSLKFPEFYSTKYLHRTNLWIGPKGTKSKLHYDSDHNLFVQIYGKKIVTLISPKYSENCYPTNITWYDGYSPIDVMQPNLDLYPEFGNVLLLQSELEAGDMLYIPKGWWHDIRSTENSISANLWWINWKDFLSEFYSEIKYKYIQGKEFDSKNSYWVVLKRNMGL